MKIAYYIHHTAIKAGGVFTYTVGVLNLLLSSNELEKIILIFSSETKKSIAKILTHPKIIPVVIDRKKSFVKFRLALSYLFFDIFLLQRNYLGEETKFKWLKNFSNWINPYKSKIKKLNPDLFHSPVQFAPIYRLDIPLITTMHDLQELIIPENFTAGERLHRALNSKKAMDESDQIIVSFNHVKEDIKKYFDTADDQVSVCPPPFHEEWFVNKSGTPAEELRVKYKLENKFILYPAAAWKHKNHIALFNALKILKDKNQIVQLICTGNKTNYYDELISISKNLGVEDQVKFIGIVSEEDLVGLYKLAALVVIPTAYEAGSGPLYEAMRYSVPVICSNVTSLPEAIGSEEFTFDPNDHQRIAELIFKGLNDERFIEKNIANSKSRLEIFKRQDYAANFLEVYQKAIQHKKEKIAANRLQSSL